MTIISSGIITIVMIVKVTVISKITINMKPVRYQIIAEIQMVRKQLGAIQVENGLSVTQVTQMNMNKGHQKGCKTKWIELLRYKRHLACLQTLTNNFRNVFS